MPSLELIIGLFAVGAIGFWIVSRIARWHYSTHAGGQPQPNPQGQPPGQTQPPPATPTTPPPSPPKKWHEKWWAPLAIFLILGVLVAIGVWLWPSLAPLIQPAPGGEFHLPSALVPLLFAVLILVAGVILIAFNRKGAGWVVFAAIVMSSFWFVLAGMEYTNSLRTSGAKAFTTSAPGCTDAGWVKLEPHSTYTFERNLTCNEALSLRWRSYEDAHIRAKGVGTSGPYDFEHKPYSGKRLAYKGATQKLTLTNLGHEATSVFIYYK